MGTDFKCGCRTSGGHWFLCKKHERDLLNSIERADLERSNTISDIVQDKKGRTIKYVNERPMKDAK